MIEINLPLTSYLFLMNQTAMIREFKQKNSHSLHIKRKLITQEKYIQIPV